MGTHGVQGEVRVQPWCDSPELYATLKVLYWDEAGERSVRVKSRPHKRIALSRLEGVDTVQAAEALRGRVLYLAREDLRLEEGRYFICDLIGLRVVDADSDEEYGELTDVSSTGANDVYHLSMDGREILIPVIPSVVIAVDVDGGVVRIRPMEGLFD